jgi:hypothetical protein
MQRLIVGLLLLGATVNLAAGARRPSIERAILSGDHYAHADRAAEAVVRLLPPGAPLTVVVYDQDLVGELDTGVWFDYRTKWLLYPRDVQVYRVAPENLFELRATQGETSWEPHASADYLSHPYVLFFRATAPPALPPGRLEILARDSMWVLTRTGGAPTVRFKARK